jgi:carboxyl-terminal processing protease
MPTLLPAMGIFHMQQLFARHSKRVALLLTIVLVCLCWFANKASSFPIAPQLLYDKAWGLVRDNYYDTSFNHQNWQLWRHKYDGTLQTDEQAYAAIRTMLKSLDDPYTHFLEPKAFNDENDAINALVCGIGISLRPYDRVHALIVNDVIEDSPAAKAGLAYGDEIIAIDGKSATGVDGEKAAGKIRGMAGTCVDLTIKHCSETRECKITRARVCIPSVTTKRLDNVGYIKLTTFMADGAADEFRRALVDLSDAQGLIIDLRDNPGGLVTNAVAIADMLMNHGRIVTTESRHGRLTDACTGMAITNQPIVLLCDHDSASASEILAGALKDNGRAVIVGSRTYGKGLVQEITRLPGGAGIHVTVARYYTPNGSDINKIGIMPNIEVEDHDGQLAEGLKVLKQETAQQTPQTNRVSSAPRVPSWLSRFLVPRT